MLKRFSFSYFLLIYFGLRIFSFYFQPVTTLNPNPSLPNTVITIIILLTAAILLSKKNPWGWHIIAAEMILGGSGGFLQAFGITLRSLLLITSLTIYPLQERKNIFAFEKDKLFIGALLLIAALGITRGLLFNHTKSLVISDAVPYLFLLYYFPLRELLKNEPWKKRCISMLQAAIFAQAIFILYTFAGLANGLLQLQDAFYHWYRDIAGGKITLVEFNFYRLVLNEQLLLVPVMLFFLYKSINEKRKYFIVALLLFLLSINLTRIYLIAIFIGTLALFTRENWKRALAVLLGSLAIFLIIFSSLFMYSSGGKSFGLEVFGLRLQSIVAPYTEESSLSRMLLLPKIFKQISEYPILGRGLGSTVSVFSPVENKLITTSNYDWGYLEILVELGLVGLGSWLFFLFNIVIKQKNLPRWQIASLVSLLVINITSPAIFHVFGITLLTLLMAQSATNASVKLPDAPPHTL